MAYPSHAEILQKVEIAVGLCLLVSLCVQILRGHGKVVASLRSVHQITHGSLMDGDDRIVYIHCFPRA